MKQSELRGQERLNRKEVSSLNKKRKRGPTAEQWNAKHPIGTRVRFQPVMGIDVFEETKTRSEAWELCGTPVVMIEGRSGGCAIDHMTVLAGAEPKQTGSAP